jgi:hypothetical protein
MKRFFCFAAIMLLEARAADLDNRERAARRADVQANSVRRAIAISEGRIQAGDDTFIVDGSRNPELLMPTELMHSLPAAFNPDPSLRKYREKWDVRGASQYLGEDPWPRLYAVAREYIDAEIEVHRLGMQIRRATVAERDSLQKQNDELQEGNRLCRLRAEALSRARNAFGRETFDRFLYRVIAPDAFRRTSTSSAEAFAETLLWQDGGCR